MVLHALLAPPEYVSLFSPSFRPCRPPPSSSTLVHLTTQGSTLLVPGVDSWQFELRTDACDHLGYPMLSIMRIFIEVSLSMIHTYKRSLHLIFYPSISHESVANVNCYHICSFILLVNINDQHLFETNTGGQCICGPCINVSIVSTLRGMRKGHASYTMHLAKFDIVPQYIKNQLAA